MRITNLTHWNTRDIAKLVYRVAEDELDRGQLKNAQIKVKYFRSWRLGCCHCGTLLRPDVRMTLYLPRPGKPIDLAQLAQVVAHEFGHAKGLKHGSDMRNTRYGWVEGWRERYAYATAFPIGVKPIVKLSAEEKLMQRRMKAVKKAQEMVRKWTTAAKRSSTMLKKWKTRLRAAEKRTLRILQPRPSTIDPQVRASSEGRIHADKIPSPAS